MGLTMRSVTALYLSVFLSCVSFAIVVPTIWPYMAVLKSKESFLACVVASYSVGEAVGAISLVHLTKSLRIAHAMIAATAVGAIGSILYVSAENFREGGIGLWLILVGRFTQGMWTGGAQAIQTIYLADVLPISDLTPTIVTLRAYASLGFILGPVFGLLLNFLPFASENKLTEPGYFVLFSGVCIGILFYTVFDEDGDRASLREDLLGLSNKRLMQIPTEQEPLMASEGGVCIGENSRIEAPLDLRTPIVLCNFAIFVLFLGFAVQETITTPIVDAYFGWTVFQANLLFVGAGLCGLFSFVGVRVLCGVFADREMMAWSLSMGIVGCMLLVSTPSDPLPSWRFLLGFFIISVAFPVGRGTTISLYTKLLPFKQQRAGQGLILAVGATARILGPFWAVCTFSFKFGGLLVFGASTALFAICLTLVVVHYHRLKT